MPIRVFVQPIFNIKKQPLTELLFPLQKLLNRPILLHGRAQVNFFNESARGKPLRNIYLVKEGR